MDKTHYHAIIIGARPAGASLAVRLAKAGMDVLILDRASFPSKPAVPSMPLVLPHTLELLAEVGITEAQVAASGAKIKRLQLEMNQQICVEIDFAKAMGNDPRQHYFYSIKRDPFDYALWENLKNYPSITAIPEFGVAKISQDAQGQVTGIEGAKGERYTADVVIGADGRFSFVASQMNAPYFNEVSDYNTDFYFAYWRGGKYTHADAMHTMHVYSNLNGAQFLIFPVSENEVAVGLQMVHDLIPKSNEQSIDDYYLAQLQTYPLLWEQIKSAEKISTVWAMKNVRNGYREVGGNGWALVGDAAHFKDSIDAQGIFDALLGAKLLAAVLVDWSAGKLSWEAALVRYRAELLAETYDMFQATQARLKQDIHDKPPTFVVKNIIRRALQDPEYQEKFVGYVTRRYPAKGWASPSLILGALVRGILRDIKG